MKATILKRTDDYILFDIDGVASGIVSAKFLRKKESDTHVFLSLPPAYEVNCRVKERNLEGKYVVVKEYVIKAEELKGLVKDHECEVLAQEQSIDLPSGDLPF